MSNPENGGNGYRVTLRDVVKKMDERDGALDKQLGSMASNLQRINDVINNPDTGGLVKIITEHESRLDQHDDKILGLNIKYYGVLGGILAGGFVIANAAGAL